MITRLAAWVAAKIYTQNEVLCINNNGLRCQKEEEGSEARVIWATIWFQETYNYWHGPALY